MFLFVFLARNKAKDVRRVREISQYLVGLHVATTLLIFPEGTDLSPSNHQKSLQFAKKEGLAEYQYVLHPKVCTKSQNVHNVMCCVCVDSHALIPIVFKNELLEMDADTSNRRFVAIA